VTAPVRHLNNPLFYRAQKAQRELYWSLTLNIFLFFTSWTSGKCLLAHTYSSMPVGTVQPPTIKLSGIREAISVARQF
jgi:hypothetical protein